MIKVGAWLGLDAGGTRTRWAVADDAGTIVAEGEGPGMTAMDASSDDGRSLMAALSRIARDAISTQPHGAHAAMTGLGDNAAIVRRCVAKAFSLREARVTVGTDIEATCRDLFAPGEGYVIYAGTGSIAAYLDGHEELHRAGGRGVGLDDGGGGFWIAREALRAIWRREDEEPGAWRDSALAQAVFAQLGDSSWARSRDFFYGSSRGEVGQLALAVARAAESDEVARCILRDAGAELARLGLALVSRYGPRPVALTGRAASLHPLIAQTVRERLPSATGITQREAFPHRAAARLAARGSSGDNSSPT